jgi:hypothetical protein
MFTNHPFNKIADRYRLYFNSMNRLLRLMVLAILSVFTQKTYSQNFRTDTLQIIEKIIEEQDTMVRSTVNPLLSTQKHTAIFEKHIDSLLFRNNNNPFRQELYNLLIKSASNSTMAKKTPSDNVAMAAMDGKFIRNIEFVQADMFAPSVTDTCYVTSSNIERAINKSHVDTRIKVLKKYLLIDPGERLDVFLVAENERILRDLSFIMDARFMAKKVVGSPDSVDLVLYIQDLMPFGLDVQSLTSKTASIGLAHYNILGYGHKFLATSYYDAGNVPHWGYDLTFGLENLAGTFAKNEFQYIHRWNQESYIVNLTREFRATNFRNAGGFIFENTEMHKDIELLDTVLKDVNLEYLSTDLWAGRMLQLHHNSNMTRSGLFVTGRLNQYTNLDGPVTKDDYLYKYQNKTLLLFSGGFSRQGFQKDNLIYTFGRIEDVPFGYYIDVISGMEWGQYKTRTYLSASASVGKRFSNSGYFYGQVKYGTFFFHKSPEQGAFQLQLKYISPLHNHRRFQYRNFVNYKFLQGFNRYHGEFTSIENSGGITGLSSDVLRGRGKMVLNLESVLFSPYKVFGFRFAFFGSVDLGMIIPYKNYELTDSRLFSGLNVGVRIRNDQLVFNTLELKFSLYPNMPFDSSSRLFTAEGMARPRFDDFFPYKPKIIIYE